MKRFIRRNPTIVIGAILLALVTLAALAAPWITGDPILLVPNDRLQAMARENVGKFKGSLQLAFARPAALVFVGS